MKKKVKTPRKPGPKPDTLKLEGKWKDAVGKALKKKYPEAGWPKPKPDKG